MDNSPMSIDSFKPGTLGKEKQSFFALIFLSSYSMSISPALLLIG